MNFIQPNDMIPFKTILNGTDQGKRLTDHLLFNHKQTTDNKCKTKCIFVHKMNIYRYSCAHISKYGKNGKPPSCLMQCTVVKVFKIAK